MSKFISHLRPGNVLFGHKDLMPADSWFSNTYVSVHTTRLSGFFRFHG